MPCGERSIDGAGDGLTDHGAHTSTDEGVLHSGEDDVVRAELADGVDDGIVEAGLLLLSRKSLFIGLQIGEVERIGRFEFEIDELVAGFEQGSDARTGVDLEVVAALWADVLVGIQIGLPDDLATVRALDPEALGADGLLLVVDNLVVFALEPAHASLSVERFARSCDVRQVLRGSYRSIFPLNSSFST